MVDGYQLDRVTQVSEKTGLGLKLIEIGTGRSVAVVFRDDATMEGTFRAFDTEPVPIAAIEWLIAESKVQLWPGKDILADFHDKRGIAANNHMRSDCRFNTDRR